jgi:hypothetical protein
LIIMFTKIHLYVLTISQKLKPQGD